MHGGRCKGMEHGGSRHRWERTEAGLALRAEAARALRLEGGLMVLSFDSWTTGRQEKPPPRKLGACHREQQEG